MKRLLFCCITILTFFTCCFSISGFAASKKVSKEIYNTYNFTRRASRRDTGHRYRFEETFYFDLTNNVLVRKWDKKSANKYTSGFDVYALTTKDIKDRVTAYNSDGEKKYCFELLDKDELRDKCDLQKSDGCFWDVREYSLSSDQLKDKLASWDVKKQPPKNMPTEFYEQFPNPDTIASFIK